MRWIRADRCSRQTCEGVKSETPSSPPALMTSVIAVDPEPRLKNPDVAARTPPGRLSASSPSCRIIPDDPDNLPPVRRRAHADPLPIGSSFWPNSDVRLISLTIATLPRRVGVVVMNARRGPAECPASGSNPRRRCADGRARETATARVMLDHEIEPRVRSVERQRSWLRRHAETPGALRSRS